jgi:hypothetical protein
MTGLVDWITGADKTQQNANNATNAAQNNMKDAIAAQQQFLQQQQQASLARLSDYLSKNQNPAKSWGNVTGPVNQNPASIGGGVLGFNGMPLQPQPGQQPGGGQQSGAINPQMIQALLAMLQKAHQPQPQPGTAGKPAAPSSPAQGGMGGGNPGVLGKPPGGMGWHGPNGHMEVLNN